MNAKAIEQGRSDAQEWIDDLRAPEDDESDADFSLREMRRAVSTGTLDADEELIASIGTTKAAELLGVGGDPFDADGVLTPAACEAFRAYSRAWAEHVREAISALTA